MGRNDMEFMLKRRPGEESFKIGPNKTEKVDIVPWLAQWKSDASKLILYCAKNYKIIL